MDLLAPALQGIRAAYYFIHSLLGKDPDYAARDREAASNFALVAKEECVPRIIDLSGLGRTMIPVPILTPNLSAYWVDLVTPIPASLAHPLIEGLRSEVIVNDPAARELFTFVPMGYRAAVRVAVAEQPQIKEDR